MSISVSFLLLLLSASPLQWTMGETANDFLRIHNHYRSLAREGLIPGQPRANYMPDLEYDLELEAAAESWANNCDFMHEPDQETGENLAISTDETDEMISEWFAEYEHFNFGPITAGVTPTYLHYTQLVWADTLRVGCVKKFCPVLTWDDRIIDDIYYTVCKYSPSGNYAGEEPYETESYETDDNFFFIF